PSPPLLQMTCVSRLVSALGRRPEAAYELGRTLGELASGDDAARAQLDALAANEEAAAQVGDLYALVDAGAGDAFDQVLNSDSSGALGQLGPPTGVRTWPTTA